MKKPTSAEEKLNVLLAYSSIELIPDKLWNQKDVRRFVDKFFRKDRFRIILDKTYFSRWMYLLEDSEKRGRPDILHFCLVNLLESIANREGKLRVWIHTINNEIIEVNPEIRIPKHYERFKGLFADLFRNKEVPKNSPNKLLLIREDLDLDMLLSKFDRIILLSDKGEFKPVKEIVKENISSNSIYIIGGFPHGDFPEEMYIRADKVYSIYEEPLPAWVVCYKLVCAFEDIVF